MTNQSPVARSDRLTAPVAKWEVPSSVGDRTQRFSDVFVPGRVDVVHGRIGRSSVVSQLVGLLVRTSALRRDQGEPVIQAILQQERFATSALGRGLATPHLLSAAVRSHVGAAMACPDGVDFGAIDNAPTRLILLLVSPAGAREEHAALMSQLVALMHDKRLAYATRPGLSSRDLYELLAAL